MPKTKRPYPPEFRRRIVELVRAGESPDNLAKPFEPSGQTIRNWVAQADRDDRVLDPQVGASAKCLTLEADGIMAIHRLTC